MFTIANVTASGQAATYFAKDNYYTEAEGLDASQWLGAGAKALGLQGKVDKEAFLNLLDGKVDGLELGRVSKDPEGNVMRQHRPGYDLTFSAPKSVSILAEVFGQQDVRLAHEKAVETTLAYVEKNLLATRAMRDGVLEVEKVDQVIFAQFRHNTSRTVDPHTHTHSVLINAGLRGDGVWRSLVNDTLYQNKKIIGAMYNAELASEIQKQGYDIERTDARGNFEIKGVSKAAIARFSQRTDQVHAALVAKGHDLDAPNFKDKEHAWRTTRASKKVLDHKEVIQGWRDSAQIAGIDGKALIEQAHTNAERNGTKPAAQISGAEAIQFATKHLFEREMVVSREQLLTTALTHGAGRVGSAAVMAAFDKAMLSGDLISAGHDALTAKRSVESERWAVAQMRAEQGAGLQLMSGEQAAKQVTQYETAARIRFSKGQREAVTHALSTGDRFLANQGLAGTGKTTMLRALATLAQESGTDLKLYGMAPTGAAAKVMASETGVDATTLSMFQIEATRRKVAFDKLQRAAVEEGATLTRGREFWVVDESSFVSQVQMSKLVRLALDSNAQVLFVGDKAQLQAVEAGKAFEVMQKAGIDTSYMTEINRQKTEATKEVVGIIVGKDRQLATDAGGVPLTDPPEILLNQNARAFTAMERNGMVQQREDGELVASVVKDVVARGPDALRETVIITPYNRDRIEINNAMRAALRERGVLNHNERQETILESKGMTKAEMKEAQYYFTGDVVRFNRDYKAMEIAKGEYLRVAAIDPNGRVVHLQRKDGTAVEWKPGVHNQVEVYEEKERGIAVGDVIRITRNEETLKNGHVGVVTSLTPTGMNINVSGVAHKLHTDISKHWEHAYASTVHAAQGATARNAVFMLRVPEGDAGKRTDNALKQMATVFGNRSFYVGATRATHDMMLYTNDTNKARTLVAAQQDKTSAMETLGELKVVPTTASPTAGTTPEKEVPAAGRQPLADSIWKTDREVAF
jgi:conjugative relaxase-like TrwC/TraI family protein